MKRKKIKGNDDGIVGCLIIIFVVAGLFLGIGPCRETFYHDKECAPYEKDCDGPVGKGNNWKKGGKEKQRERKEEKQREREEK